MSNATRWYTTVEAVKAAIGIAGPSLDTLIGGYIEDGSEDVERFLGRRFIPQTAVKYFRWPQPVGGALSLRFPDEDLIAVTQLQAAAQDSSPTTIDSDDYFVEPVNSGPPYNRIEIDLSSSAAFASGDTPQRSIAVTGRWGYGEDTKAAGAVVGAVDASQLTLVITDSSLIAVGDTIKIAPGAAAPSGSLAEALFVSAKALLTAGTTLNDTLTADQNDVTVTVVDGTKIKQGEVLTFDSERMLAESISSNNVTVERAVDGSILAAHSSGITVYAQRTLTVARAVNGTTATVHDTATTIAKYAPPADIREYVLAHAITNQHQDATNRTGVAGGDQGTVETRGFSIWAMKKELIENYGRVSF